MQQSKEQKQDDNFCLRALAGRCDAGCWWWQKCDAAVSSTRVTGGHHWDKEYRGGCWWLESCRRLAAVLAGKLRTLLLSCLELVLAPQQVGPSTRGLAAAGGILADISRGSGCSNREQRRQSHRRRGGGLVGLFYFTWFCPFFPHPPVLVHFLQFFACSHRFYFIFGFPNF